VWKRNGVEIYVGFEADFVHEDRVAGKRFYADGVIGGMQRVLQTAGIND